MLLDGPRRCRRTTLPEGKSSLIFGKSSLTGRRSSWDRCTSPPPSSCRVENRVATVKLLKGTADKLCMMKIKVTGAMAIKTGRTSGTATTMTTSGTKEEEAGRTKTVATVWRRAKFERNIKKQGSATPRSLDNNINKCKI
ncbi:uncharacterized protein LOC144090454 isoform X2 [Stigmatopora argus]